MNLNVLPSNKMKCSKFLRCVVGLWTNKNVLHFPPYLDCKEQFSLELWWEQHTKIVGVGGGKDWKGSSAITFRRKMSGSSPSPNISGKLTPKGRAWMILQAHSFDKQNENHVTGDTLQTSKINHLEMGLIRVQLTQIITSWYCRCLYEHLIS